MKTSRTSVHDFFSRYSFGWRLERGAWTAKYTENMPEYEEQKRRVIAQKLFEAIADVDCDPKLLVVARSLELEAQKLKLAETSAKTRFELETAKLDVSKRRVSLLEEKLSQARAAVQELRDPKKADDPQVREAILRKIDEVMGIQAPPQGAKT